jgi:hypothetical protein
MAKAERMVKMTIFEKPYFMKNEDWFFFDEEECMYRLTEKATEKAKQSYEEYYKQFEASADI